MEAQGRSYARIARTVRWAVQGFFREVEVVGAEHVPADRGGLVVSWHPNGVVDPALIFTHFPQRIVFGARHGLFKLPLFGSLLRSVNAVPIYRAMDLPDSSADARREANERSLNAMAERIRDGSFSALFPEGDSHDKSHMLSLKTGAARLYYRARQLSPSDAPPPCIVAVGLHYDEKDLFRSHALVEFSHPLQLPPELDVTPAPDEAEEVSRTRTRALTDLIEAELTQLVRPTETWQLHFEMQRARQLVRAERSLRHGLERPSSMDERVVGFARIWTGYYQRQRTHPEQVLALRRRIAEYDRALRDLGVKDRELDSAPRLMSWWLPLLTLAQFVGTFLLLPPIVFLGYAVNLPPALLVAAIAARFAKRRKDSASIKLVLGALLFPLTWLGAGVAGAFAHDAVHQAYPAIGDGRLAAGTALALLSALGGAIAVRYWRVARELLRALRVRVTRHRRQLTLAWLRDERARLYDALMALAEGLELPEFREP